MKSEPFDLTVIVPVYRYLENEDTQRKPLSYLRTSSVEFFDNICAMAFRPPGPINVPAIL